MSQETTALLRSILFQIKKAKSLKEAEHAVKVMCSKDDIAAVEKEISELNKDE